MSPVYLNTQHSSSMPFVELKGDQHTHSLSLVAHLHDHVANNDNSNAYFLHSTFGHLRGSAGVQSALDYDYSRRAQEKVEKLVISEAKPNDVGQIQASPQQLQYTPDGSGCSYNYPVDHHRDHELGSDQTADNKQSKKCKATKLRIMHKMTVTCKKPKITGDHKLYHQNLVQPHHTNMFRNTGNQMSNGLIRVCSDCHTTTTPLWRSGPQGPKSLCNACGIRQRKARRAATAAAAAELAKNTTVASPTMSSASSSCVEAPKLQRKADYNDMSYTLPIKKRCKMTDNATWNYNHNNSHNNNNNNSNNSNKINNFTGKSQRLFPRDEEEGAILLMALSCGLPCSS